MATTVTVANVYAGAGFDKFYQKIFEQTNTMQLGFLDKRQGKGPHILRDLDLDIKVTDLTEDWSPEGSITSNSKEIFVERMQAQMKVPLSSFADNTDVDRTGPSANDVLNPTVEQGILDMMTKKIALYYDSTIWTGNKTTPVAPHTKQFNGLETLWLADNLAGGVLQYIDGGVAAGSILGASVAIDKDNVRTEIEKLYQSAPRAIQQALKSNECMFIVSHEVAYAWNSYYNTVNVGGFAGVGTIEAPYNFMGLFPMYSCSGISAGSMCIVPKNEIVLMYATESDMSNIAIERLSVTQRYYQVSACFSGVVDYMTPSSILYYQGVTA